MLFKDISYLELTQPFVQWSRTICEMLVESIMRNNSVKLFWIWTSGSGGDAFWRYFLSGALGPFCLAERKHVCHILVEGIKRNNSVKLFWSWTSGSGGDAFWKISYLKLLRPSCSVERNNLSNFERGYHGEHSCEVIWNLDQWFRRCRLKDFFFWALAALLFSGAILKEGIMGNIHLKLYEIWTSDSGGDVV